MLVYIRFANSSLDEITKKRRDKLVQRYFYKAYGETKVLKATRSRDAELLVENPFAFNSREWEREAEIYCHRARCRDPRTGRWLSPDPNGFFRDNKNNHPINSFGKSQIEPNLYRYVFNNPTKYRDPSGKWPEWLDDGVCGITGRCDPSNLDSPDWADTLSDVIDDIINSKDKDEPNSCTKL